MPDGSLSVHRAQDRAVTDGAGRWTAHSFSFGAHYDPGNVSLGAVLAHNDERLSPGAGYDDHPHHGVEIVTVVLEGRLRHRSGVGDAELGPRQVQRLRAGAGVVHAETNAGTGPLRFLQTWLRVEDEASAAYAVHRPAGTALAGAGTPLDLHCGAALHRWRLRPGQRSRLPATAWRHLFVVAGRLDVEGPDGHRLGPDDALRTLGGEALDLRCVAAADVLVWAPADPPGRG